ncbi:FAD-dependent oxidoreductase [Nocardia sp. NBC_01503]|uniref:FAD-dependent oxidoreductase n=1 Tax=Nocardia sp. NBC_01503 TaxID=2975997 RepID=UPI002E7AB30F|nr:FAD-dependent oxidoreductase [Nocardia sp. NBC_01503]WTL32185.1 FAD-dependent oxidoreductase [Nocardia sp. NBC_01503]
MELTDRICIVGAGQSGIMAAARLRELGFTNIDILEAGPEPGGYCQTAEIDGATYDFQAHLVIQQDFGEDIEGTAIHELLTRHPVELQTEALYFVSRDDSGKPRMAVPPHFVPLFQLLTPEQAADQLAQAWTIIERAIRESRGPGMHGLVFDRVPGETWETYRARHAPLVGELLQGLTLYANMRRPRQPAETVININAHISGHVSQLAKMILSLYPAQREALLARMPHSLLAQMSSRRPVTMSLRQGFISLLRRMIADHDLNIRVGTRVTSIEPVAPEGVRVGYTTAEGTGAATYARVIVTARPAQIRDIFPTGEIHDLFGEGNCPRAWTRSYLVKVADEIIGFPRKPNSPEPLGFWVIDPYGSYTDTDPEQAMHRITAVNKQHPGPYWVCFSNSDLSISDAQAWNLARESLFLFDDPELITETIAEWPAYPSAAAIRDGWFDRIATIQGRDGIWFTGEILSGPTAECISAFARAVIPAWFGPGNRPCAHARPTA